MNDAAEALMVSSVAAPLLGALVGLILVSCKPQWVRAASISAGLGLLGSFVSAAGLTGILGGSVGVRAVSITLGTWLDLTGLRRLEIGWGLQADQSAALWITVLSGLAWMTVAFAGREPNEKPSAAFSITTAMVSAAAIGFVLSSGLIQMLTCWTALSLATLLMVGWSSRTGASIHGMRRAVQAGLPGDLLLLWAVVWMAQAGGLTTFADLSSADGLERLGGGNPALPGVIGCLFVLGVFGRCGLFPFFGWHHEAAGWEARSCIVNYGIGHVPSAVWLLLKCQPMLAASEVPLALLGGMGTLAAVVGAFVACGQDELHRRLAYLLAAQTGVMLAGLGSGLDEAVNTCMLHQCGISLAAFALFASCRIVTANGSSADIANRNHPRAAVWCAALSLAGVIPFSGGWSQQGMIELDVHPVSWPAKSGAESATDAEGGPVTNETDAEPNAVLDAARNGVTSARQDLAVPRWGWICGLWLAQGLSAFAAIRLVGPGDGRNAGSTRSQVQVGSGELPTGFSPRPEETNSLQPVSWVINGAAMLLLIGGPCGWLLGAVSFPHTPEGMLRLLIGQCAAAVGLLVGWQSLRVAASAAGIADPANRWESLARLSRQRLYVDEVVRWILSGPDTVARTVSGWLGPAAIDRVWTGMIVRAAAWLGTQVESLHVERADFYLATVVLGTATLLLTLILSG